MAESACTLKKGDRGGEEGQFKMMDQHLQSYSPWKAALCQGPARSSVYVRGGEFHGQRSLVGYSPRDRKESDMI